MFYTMLVVPKQLLEKEFPVEFEALNGIVDKLKSNAVSTYRKDSVKIDFIRHIRTAMLSKMERGDRFFRKEDIVALAKIFKQPEEELLTLWLADKILKTIEEEDHKEQALKLALKSIK